MSKLSLRIAIVYTSKQGDVDCYCKPLIVIIIQRERPASAKRGGGFGTDGVEAVVIMSS